MSDTDSIDCVVVGAGVIGLAVARALAEEGREVLVLERAETIGTETSSRNSEVIHAGIYYPFGSLKHRLCVAGREALYAYCAERGVAHRRSGKLIVATRPEESAQLDLISRRARENGVEIERLSRSDVAAIEPELQCEAALLSPSTGIVDSHGFMLALQGDAERAGALFAFHAPFAGAERHSRGFLVKVAGENSLTLRCNLLINAAGLGPVRLQAMWRGFSATRCRRSIWRRGAISSFLVRRLSAA